MNKPLLYEPFDTDGVAHDMRQDNGGNWVHAEDYWVLSAEVTKWKEKAKFWKRRADQRQIDINELKQNPALVLGKQ